MILLSSCSVKSPTAPELSPFVGKWEGLYQSPLAGASDNNSLKLNILSGGLGVGTAIFIYEMESVFVMETLFLELEISPAGNITGTGTWYIIIEGQGGAVSEGKVSGELNPFELSGSGEVMLWDGIGFIEIQWEVSKAGD